MLLVSADEDGIDRLLSLAEPLARLPGRELIIARLIGDERELDAAVASVSGRRDALGVNARAAAFTTADPAGDVLRLAAAYDVELLLLNAPPEVDATPLPADLATVLERSPADVAVVAGTPVDWTQGTGVFVPFGGAVDDWAALELGAWRASAVGTPLRVIGTRADPHRGQRDASRLLANASLAVQRVAGVPSESLLLEESVGALF